MGAHGMALSSQISELAIKFALQELVTMQRKAQKAYLQQCSMFLLPDTGLTKSKKYANFMRFMACVTIEGFARVISRYRNVL